MTRKIGVDLQTGKIDYSFYRGVLNQFAAVPPDEWDYLNTLLSVKSLEKGTHLLKEGETCQKLYYIMNGGARFYYINYLGQELSSNFIFENNFVVAFTSLFNRTPSEENIVLLEDTNVFVIHYNDFKSLLKRHPVWEILLNKLLAMHLFRISEKEKMLLLDDLDTRYQRLMETRPYLFQRVEQRHIASYLGMTPETLSRVKKRTYERK